MFRALSLALFTLVNVMTLANAKPVALLALGDSLTAGYGLAADQGFTAQLQAALRKKYPNLSVVNAGVSGDTSADGLARLDWVLTPDIGPVLVELGANDALRGLDPALTEKNLDLILTNLADRKHPVLLLGMQAPANMGPVYVERFNAIYPRLAAKHAVPLYPFFLEGVAMVPGLNQEDGIHPNAKGVTEIVSRLLPSVEELLAPLLSDPGASEKAGG